MPKVPFAVSLEGHIFCTVWHVKKLLHYNRESEDDQEKPPGKSVYISNAVIVFDFLKILYHT